MTLEALRETIAEFGAAAYLVTVDEAGLPHVVSVSVRVDEGHLTVGAGRTSAANLAGRPSATLLWPPVAGGEYSLIVDGTGERQDDEPVIAIRPSSAVLHRTADAPGSGPRCVAVDQR